MIVNVVEKASIFQSKGVHQIQILEDVVIHTNSIHKIKVVVGKLNFPKKSQEVFEDLVLDFLDSIYLAIKNKKSNFIYSDLMTFGFWCRKSNLIKLKEFYQNRNLMLGRGNVLHITPSNVPMNFAYSMIFGLLSGNNNIVRLPNRNFFQIEILCRIISNLLKKKKYKSLSSRICLIKYEKSDHISSELSRKVDARMIWGGDKTITQFKKYHTQPRCVDLTFSNRYSISLIDSSKILKLDDNKIKNLANRFYNDAYTMDQQGCSSPQALVWLGKGNNAAKEKFWNVLAKLVDKKYRNDLSVTNKKISSISESAVRSDFNFKTNLSNFKVIKLSIKNPSSTLEKIQCHFGTFAEINIKNIQELKKIVTKKFQTLTCYGFENKKLEKFILRNGVTGIDRIVPIGRAFDMGQIWDGYDIIHSLSRIIAK